MPPAKIVLGMMTAILLVAGMAFVQAPKEAAAMAATMYKSAGCECCDGYADYLRANNVELTVIVSNDIEALKRSRGIPEELWSCHTLVLSGVDYVVEGHAPIEVVLRLLEQGLDGDGIALPGMPAGSPGMSGQKDGSFDIYEFGDGHSSLFARI